MQLFGDIKRLTPVGVDAVILYFKGDTLDKANAACQRWLAMIDSRSKLNQLTTLVKRICAILRQPVACF
jgi:hypothetical protein